MLSNLEKQATTLIWILGNKQHQEKIKQKRTVTKRTSYFIDKHISFYSSENDNFLESHYKVDDSNEVTDDEDEESRGEYSESEYEEEIDDDDDINEQVIFENNTNPFQISRVNINNNLNYNNNLISQVFGINAGRNNILIEEIFNDLYLDTFYNNSINNINNENINNENINNEENESSIIIEEEEEKDTDSIS